MFAVIHQGPELREHVLSKREVFGLMMLVCDVDIEKDVGESLVELGLAYYAEGGFRILPNAIGRNLLKRYRQEICRRLSDKFH